jgi:hypothetical protein
VTDARFYRLTAVTIDSPTTQPTIYEWGGGRPAFARWLNIFYDLVEADDLLAPVFGGRVGEAHRRNTTTWWCEVMGGPPEYTDGRAATNTCSAATSVWRSLPSSVSVS